MLPIDHDREAFFRAFRIKSEQEDFNKIGNTFDEARENLDIENKQATEDRNHMMGL